MLLASGGKHLAMLDENSLACPVGLFASAWAGMPYVPINYRLTGPEIDALLERVTPCVLVASPERAAAFAGREGVVVQTREEFLAAALLTVVVNSARRTRLGISVGTQGPPREADVLAATLLSMSGAEVNADGAEFAQPGAEFARLLDIGDELLAVAGRTHGRTAADAAAAGGVARQQAACQRRRAVVIVQGATVEQGAIARQLAVGQVR